MLKKLFRHEWKDCWKIVGIMNIVVLVFSFMGTLVFNENLWELADSNEYVAMGVALYIIFYFAAIIALSLCTGFFFYYRFFKNLYTDEGYLLHTLPVTSHQLIWSKTFVAIIWQIISGLVVSFSILNFINYCVVADGETSIWSEFGQLFAELGNMFAPYMIPLVIVLVLYCLVAPFFSIFLGYAAISLGQCTKKHKLLAAVGIYFGMTTLIQIVSSFATLPIQMYLASVSLDTQEGVVMYMTLIFGIITVVMAALAALFYYLTHHVMKNRLNLE